MNGRCVYWILTVENYQCLILISNNNLAGVNNNVRHTVMISIKSAGFNVTKLFLTNFHP